MTIKYRDLVDPDEGRVDALIYADDAIYDAEMRNIFGKCWLFLAHESMLPYSSKEGPSAAQVPNKKPR